MGQKSSGGDRPLARDTASLSNENPEALATFAATARNDGRRPEDAPAHATAETAAIPTDPAVKQHAGAEVLKAGAQGTPGTAQAAVDQVPDRTKADQKR